MANRRMFAKSITNSSRFLMMPQSSQNLYFHFGMNADDDGFCEHFTIMRMTESKPDDLKVLQAKGFIKVFDDKILIILDWKENNYLRSDRYTPSKYLKEYKEEIKLLAEGGIPKTDQRLTQVRLGKDRLGKDNKEREEKSTPSEEMKLFLEDNKIFFEELASFVIKQSGMPQELVIKELNNFKGYWTERNKSGTKQRWESEKHFQLKRRLLTWFQNKAKWDKQKVKTRKVSTTF